MLLLIQLIERFSYLRRTAKLLWVYTLYTTMTLLNYERAFSYAVITVRWNSISLATGWLIGWREAEKGFILLSLERRTLVRFSSSSPWHQWLWVLNRYVIISEFTISSRLFLMICWNCLLGCGWAGCSVGNKKMNEKKLIKIENK